MTSRTPAQYDWTNALFNDRRLTKHFTHPRRSKISHVTLHHMTIISSGSDASNTAALKGCYSTWQTRQASANYGVAGDQVWQFVGDGDAPWSDANGPSNQSTLSIEHANSTAGPGWKIADKTMATGQRLVATLHRLYGLGRPSRKTVKVHQDFYATECPGPYMMARLDAYITAAAKFYDAAGTTTPKPTPVDPKPVPVEPTDPKPTPEVPVPSADSCTFTTLAFNIYAPRYTGGKFSAGRKSDLKATLSGPTGANASINLLSEVNDKLAHDTMVALLGKQFAHEDTFTTARGNNHQYPDANKWERTGHTEIELKSTTVQDRKITLTTERHKATGIVVSFWNTHFSSATHGASPADATRSQIVEAKAVARIIAGKPLPDWDIKKSIGYGDTNFDDAEKYIEPAGVKEIAHLVTITNGQLKSLHTLGKAPDKGYRRDNVFVGSKVKVVVARQIAAHYGASDHLAQVITATVSA